MYNLLLEWAETQPPDSLLAALADWFLVGMFTGPRLSEWAQPSGPSSHSITSPQLNKYKDPMAFCLQDFTFAIATRDAIAEAGVSPTLATFDLSPDVLGALEAGEMAFAIDQQQYLQGYLPIMFMVLFNENLNTVGGGLPVLTGPGFVTSENAADVAALSDAGTR